MGEVYDNQGLGATVTVDGNNSTGNLPVTLSQNSITVVNSGTTATSNNFDYTVGASKYWILKRGQMQRVNAGVMTVEISDDAGSTFVPLYGGASGTELSVDLSNIRLKATDVIRFAHATGTSGNMWGRIAYEEYDA
jgi:hypothetical protein